MLLHWSYAILAPVVVSASTYLVAEVEALANQSYPQAVAHHPQGEEA